MLACLRFFFGSFAFGVSKCFIFQTCLRGRGSHKNGVERGWRGKGCCWCCGVKSGLSMYAGSFVGLIGWGSNVGNATQMHLERFAALFFYFFAPFPPPCLLYHVSCYMLHCQSYIYTSLSFFFSIALSDCITTTTITTTNR